MAALALALAATAVYLASLAGATQIVDEVPAGAHSRLALEDKLYNGSQKRLGRSKWFSLTALLALAAAIAILWYWPAK